MDPVQPIAGDPPTFKRRRSTDASPDLANPDGDEGPSAGGGATPTAGGGKRGIRRTQRAPLSCTACAKRKVKCSKTSPCVQCLARGEGHMCKREQVITDRGRTLVIPGETSTMRTVEDLLQNLQRLEEENARLRAAAAAPSSASPSSSSTFAVSEQTELERVATALNLLELGRDRREEHVAYSPTSSFSPLHGALGSSPGPDEPLPFDSSILPHPMLSAQLVTYAVHDIGWLYSTVHNPTCLQQHHRFQQALSNPARSVRDAVEEVGFSWTALYFACLALAVHNLTTDRAAQLGVQMPSLINCQAIATLTHIFHEYGTTSLRNSLLAVATRTAQQLGVHLLNEREERRRAWWMLIHLEWITVPIGLPFAAPLEHLEVPFPLNSDDLSINPHGPVVVPPLAQPTPQSYHIARSRISQLMLRFYTRYRVLERADPARLPLVQETDEVLEKFFDAQPFFSPSYTQPVPPDVQAWLPKARVLLRSTVAHQRLLVYRDFFTLGFTDPHHRPAYQHAIDRARDILHILLDAQAVSFGPGKMVTHWLAASNVLALDYRFSSARHAAERAQQRKEIELLLAAVKHGDRFEPHAEHVVRQVEDLLNAADAQALAPPLPPVSGAAPPPAPFPAVAPPLFGDLFPPHSYDFLPPPAPSFEGAVSAPPTDPALLALFNSYEAGAFAS
ncbi:hypothetical protein JCM10207_004215 [Rhodosporidiobolus poonsookiae]